MSELNFASVMACADPAIRGALTRHFDNRFGQRDYFWLPKLGGVKDLLSPDEPAFRDYILAEIQKAQKVHSFGLVVLVNHSLCGAYTLDDKKFDNPKEEETFHSNELKQAEVGIREAFPKMAVERHYFLKTEQRMAW